MSYSDSDSSASTLGCGILLIGLCLSPLIWLAMLIAGSDYEEPMRIPAIVGGVLVVVVGLLLWRMSKEAGQPRLWKQVTRPAGVRPYSGPVGQLWSGSPVPDQRIVGREKQHTHQVTIGRHTVYGFLAVDDQSRAEDWFMLCELPYSLPDLDVQGQGDSATLDAGPGSSGDSFRSDIDTPALRTALTAGPGSAAGDAAHQVPDVRIRGRFVVSSVDKARPRQYLAALVAEAPRLAAVVDAIPRDVHLRWSPQARNEMRDQTPDVEWDVWNPGQTPDIQD